jgi:hypothetical protein
LEGCVFAVACWTSVTFPPTLMTAVTPTPPPAVTCLWLLNDRAAILAH